MRPFAAVTVFYCTVAAAQLPPPPPQATALMPPVATQQSKLQLAAAKEAVSELDPVTNVVAAMVRGVQEILSRSNVTADLLLRHQQQQRRKSGLHARPSVVEDAAAMWGKFSNLVQKQMTPSENSTWLSALDLEPYVLYDQDGLKQAADFFDGLVMKPELIKSMDKLLPNNVLRTVRESWHEVVQDPDFPLPTQAVGQAAKQNFDAALHQAVQAYTKGHETNLWYTGSKYQPAIGHCWWFSHVDGFIGVSHEQAEAGGPVLMMTRICSCVFHWAMMATSIVGLQMNFADFMGGTQMWWRWIRLPLKGVCSIFYWTLRSIDLVSTVALVTLFATGFGYVQNSLMEASWHSGTTSFWNSLDSESKREINDQVMELKVLNEQREMILKKAVHG